MNLTVNNFTVIESAYGRFVVNRHCAYQAEHLIKTGLPHIQPELQNILGIVGSLAPECVIVDAGANIGLVAMPMAQAVKSRRGVVHAFEVQRMMAYALCGTAALNDLENLIVHHNGLGAAREVMRASKLNYSEPQDFGLFSLVDHTDAAEFEAVEILVLDDLGLPRLDFLKIDVEGMEIKVLEGAHRMIAAFEPWCWVEYWKTGKDLIREQFKGLEYRFYVMDDLNMLCAPASRLQASQISIQAQEV